VKRRSFDNAQRHVTTFRPISEAARSWSYDNRNFKFGQQVNGSVSQPADDKSSLKGSWSGTRDAFKKISPLKYLCNGCSYRHVNELATRTVSLMMINCPQVSVVRITLHILEFYTPWNISATAKGRDFKFRTLAGRVKYELCDDWLSPKWVWSGSRDPFQHFWDQTISLDLIKVHISNLGCRLQAMSSVITHVIVLHYGRCIQGQERYKWQIYSYNGRLIGYIMCPIEWRQYQWRWVTLLALRETFMCSGFPKGQSLESK